MVVIMIRDKKQILLPLIEESNMSIDLLNSIINGDYVLANRLFEERLSDIQEKKLYEIKRMSSANLYESYDRLQQDRNDLKSGKKVRASDVYKDPRDNVTTHKEIEDAKKSASNSSTAQTQQTRQLKKLPSLRDMKKAERQKKLASIGDRIERLRKRGHSDPGRHLARAYGSSVGKAIGRTLATPAKIAGGVAQDIANAVALEE